MYVRMRDGAVEDVQTARSTSRRASSRRSCAAAGSPRPPTSPRGSAASARSPTRRAPSAAIEDGVRRRASRAEIRALRRLMYCGEWIESHALHVFMLHAPDFLGYQSAFEMAAEHAESVEGGLAIKKAGNELMRVIGGRAIHPINVRVGGFYRAPPGPSSGRSSPKLERARELLRDVGALGRRPPVPGARVGIRARRAARARSLRDRERPPRLVERARPRRRPSTRSISSRSRSSTRPHCTRGCASGGNYLVGPLARYALNAATGSRRWRGRRPPRPGSSGCARNPFQSIIVRAWRSSTRSTRRCG